MTVYLVLYGPDRQHTEPYGVYASLNAAKVVKLADMFTFKTLPGRIWTPDPVLQRWTVSKPGEFYVEIVACEVGVPLKGLS